MKIVEVIWLDAQSGFSSAIGIDEVEDIEPLLTRSVGYLLREDKDKIVLGFMMFDTFNSFKHWQLIPKGMIKKINTIKKGGDD